MMIISNLYFKPENGGGGRLITMILYPTVMSNKEDPPSNLAHASTSCDACHLSVRIEFIPTTFCVIILITILGMAALNSSLFVSFNEVSYSC